MTKYDSGILVPRESIQHSKDTANLSAEIASTIYEYWGTEAGKRLTMIDLADTLIQLGRSYLKTAIRDQINAQVSEREASEGEPDAQ